MEITEFALSLAPGFAAQEPITEFLWLRRRGGEIDRRVDEIALGARKEMRA